MGRRQQAIEDTRNEWRALGFYYDKDDRKWSFIGDKAGLLRFVQLLLDYANDPANEGLSEHKHYGPYMYLEIMTASERSIDGHAISGRLKDLNCLASIIEKTLTNCKPRDKFAIGAEYTPEAKLDLEFQVKEDGFDPSSIDPMEWASKIDD